MSNPKITIEEIISQNIAKVWECWTGPEHITKWNFASAEWCCPSASNDVKVGGVYVARMEAKDGSFGFDFGGVYDEVEHHRKLVFTMDDERQVATSFESVGESTKVTTVFDAEQENSLELQRQGWLAILQNFKRYAEAYE